MTAWDGAEKRRVFTAFEDLLGSLTLNRADLGRRMKLGASTVGNWASRSQRPSLKSMKAAVAVLEGALTDLLDRTKRMKEVLDVVDALVAASEIHNAARTHTSLDALLETSRRLSSKLDEMPKPRKRGRQ